MFNKFVIVIALLISLSMSSNLQFLSDDNKCEYGTLQEVMDKCRRYYYSYHPGSIDADTKNKLEFLEILAQFEATFLSAFFEPRKAHGIIDYYGIRANISKYVINTVVDNFPNGYTDAAVLLIKSLRSEDLKYLFFYGFVYNYLKAQIDKTGKNLSSCLTERDNNIYISKLFKEKILT
jgi:hypothetical protein